MLCALGKAEDAPVGSGALCVTRDGPPVLVCWIAWRPPVPRLPGGHHISSVCREEGGFRNDQRNLQIFRRAGDGRGRLFRPTSAGPSIWFRLIQLQAGINTRRKFFSR